MSVSPHNRPLVGIGYLLLGMLAISVNDMLMKYLSGDYPLHQMVFVRSAIGIVFSLILVQVEGGFGILRSPHLRLHVLRGLLVVAANMAYFAALASLPLADATALFFVAPLFITLLSIPILGERVGPRRLAAVVVGFLGVLVMLRPGFGDAETRPDLVSALLPVIAALGYAGMQVLTRRLGATAKASAMAVYIQSTFLSVSLAFGLVAGDGRFAEGLTNESALFLLRAWSWPESGDWPLFATLGFMSAIIGYSLSQAYRSAAAATVAPFEYVALPLAIGWGWLVFDHLPDAVVLVGSALIAGAGIYVFVREGRKAKESA